MLNPAPKSSDPISIIAIIGAPLLVGILLVYRVAAGQWGSVTFMAIIAGGVILQEIIGSHGTKDRETGNHEGRHHAR